MSTAVAEPPVPSPALASDDLSLAQRLVAPLALLPPAEREARIEETLDQLSEDELSVLLSWEGQGRPSQRIATTGDSKLVALIGGRGSGKTRAGAEGLCDRIEAGELQYGALVSRTPGDVRRVMIEGPSGLIACGKRRGITMHHRPSLAQIQIVGGGTIATYSAQEPDQLRGPEHDTVWADEFAAWPNKVDPQGGTAFSNLVLGLRSGRHPLGIFTTTPKAVPAVREIMKDKTGLWRVARMATLANAANLSPGFLPDLIRLYGGTRLFAQEVEGLYIEDVEGALWTTARLEASRIVPLDHDIELAGMTETDALQAKKYLADQLSGGLIWIYVAVDPSVAEDGGGDECGIVVGGVGADRRLYVLGDYSGHLSPESWAQRVSWAYRTVGANSAVVEGNLARSLVGDTLHNVDPELPIEWVQARQAKRARAEPVSVLWKDDGALALAAIVGSLPGLEAECTGWDSRSNVSPNRIDALTWLGHRCFEHLFHQDPGWAASTGWTLPR